MREKQGAHDRTSISAARVMITRSDAEELERLESAMEATPRGAVAVSLIAVGLLLICWLAIYFFVFLPRGTVG